MNPEINAGDYVTTTEGYVQLVISVDGDYIQVRTAIGDVWMHRKLVVDVNP